VTAGVSADDPALRPTPLRARLEAVLPDYMVPSAFVVLDALPLSPSGKLDRRALPAAPEVTGLCEYEVPTSADEALLCRLFATLTGAQRVSVTDSFFALGGHSLLAMRLVAQLRAERGVELPLRAVFAHPTVRALARELAMAGADRLDYDPLLPLKVDGTDRPMFCIHPAGGSSTVYANLVNHLPKALPVFGMQAKALSEPEASHTSVPEMAECYIQALRKVQPVGPYRLLGWSFGGVVLQEMIAQLEAQGDVVEIGILLDSPLTGDPVSGSETQDDEASLLAKQSETFDIVTEGMLEADIKAALLLAAKRKGLMQLEAEIDDLDLMLGMMLQMPKLMAEWNGPRRLRAPIVFIKAADNKRRDQQDRLNCITSGSVRIFDVSANHERMCDRESSAFIANLIADLQIFT